MKFIFIALILMIAIAFGQGPNVMSQPPTTDSYTLWSSSTITGSTTPSWCTVFPLDYKWGSATLFLKTDTTDASVASGNQSDSCLTVFLQIKDKTLGWSRYYDDTNAYTRLDSIARTIVNVGGTNIVRMNLADVTSNKQWTVGDSGRVGITIGTSDSLIVSGKLKLF